MEIARMTRTRDGVVFRIWDDLPTCCHYYTIEYAKTYGGQVTCWHPHTWTRIPTLAEAYATLEFICNN